MEGRRNWAYRSWPSDFEHGGLWLLSQLFVLFVNLLSCVNCDWSESQGIRVEHLKKRTILERNDLATFGQTDQSTYCGQNSLSSPSWKGVLGVIVETILDDIKVEGRKCISGKMLKGLHRSVEVERFVGLSHRISEMCELVEHVLVNLVENWW
jgi:hypothetical protein